MSRTPLKPRRFTFRLSDAEVRHTQEQLRAMGILNIEPMGPAQEREYEARLRRRERDGKGSKVSG